MPYRWSRRQAVQGAGAVGLELLAGCGRWPLVICGSVGMRYQGD
jgi:hypothetical protein